MFFSSRAFISPEQLGIGTGIDIRLRDRVDGARFAVSIHKYEIITGDMDERHFLNIFKPVIASAGGRVVERMKNIADISASGRMFRMKNPARRQLIGCAQRRIFVDPVMFDLILILVNRSVDCGTGKDPSGFEDAGGCVRQPFPVRAWRKRFSGFQIDHQEILPSAEADSFHSFLKRCTVSVIRFRVEIGEGPHLFEIGSAADRLSFCPCRVQGR